MDVPTVSPAVLDALSASRRRIALAILFERSVTMSVDELASAVALRASNPDEDGDSNGGAAEDGDEDTDGDTDRVRDGLLHVDLPTLADAETVTFDPESALVAAVDDPPFDRAWVERLVADHPDSGSDPMLAALASERRQAVLYDLLTDGPATEIELATTVAAHERETTPEAISESIMRVVEISLTHTHVPFLMEAELVARDPDTYEVTPDATAWRSDPWVAASPFGGWAAAD